MQTIVHYPRLDTILAVESVLRNAKEAISKNELDRRLEKKVMRATLNVILRYLEESSKIAILKEGIIWIAKEDASTLLLGKLKRGVSYG